jgi:ribosome biogenesis GTPase
VLAALEDGTLDARRFENYQKMIGELHYLERKQDVGASLTEREKWKKIHKQARKIDR